ncbi:MAG: leucyl aminopeptidase [Erysipelotrichaceae bacterium]|nr:leucyl aminopeptidase [Erysipelotrichaceae bacterium]
MKQVSYSFIDESTQDIIYPIYEDRDICPKVIEILGYDINSIVDKKLSQITTIYTLGKYSFEKIVFIGLGKSTDITTAKMRDAFKSVSQQIKQPASFDAKRVVTDVIDIHKVTQLFVESYIYASYKEHVIGHDIQEMIKVDIMALEDVQADIEIGEAYGNGINYARGLADAPANLMTPKDIVKAAIQLAKEYDLELTILDNQKLTEMGAGGILAVNQGSDLPAYLLALKYNHGGNQPYKAVVGKGITFDAGGYNIKGNSYGMKYDMCGAASVLGVMKILADIKANVNVYGIIATTENLINGSAYKPQDVITTLAKKTVEIVDTDAEGRIVLCDALTYAQQLGAYQIIDLATLTGACEIALADVYTGVFSNDDEYFDKFNHVLKESDEKGWRLPVDDAYFNKLKSNSADFKNWESRTGGASTAASFLQQFIEEDTKWIHLDIAGTADSGGKAATGVMIRSVVNMLKD